MARQGKSVSKLMKIVLRRNSVLQQTTVTNLFRATIMCQKKECYHCEMDIECGTVGISSIGGCWYHEWCLVARVKNSENHAANWANSHKGGFG